MVGLSILSGAHLPLAQKVVAGAARRRRRRRAAGRGRQHPDARPRRACRSSASRRRLPDRHAGSTRSSSCVRGSAWSGEHDERPPVDLGSRASRSSRSTARRTWSERRREAIGEPGEYPFTRGIHPLMYRKRPWTMRQYSGFGTAAETHERFLYLIEHGQTGLNVAFDLPTQCGLDSDDPMAEGEVGRVGMAVDTLADMEEAFDGIDLNEITVSLTINGAAVADHGHVLRDGAKARLRPRDAARHGPERHPQGVRRPRHLDLPGRAVACAWSATPSSSARANVAEVQPGQRLRLPHPRVAGRRRPRRWPTASPSPAPTSTTCSRAGSTSTTFARGLSFNFDIHGNLWEQVAKFRAGRRLWAQILKEQLRREEPALDAAAHDRRRRRRRPHHRAAREQHRARRLLRPGQRARRGTQTMALCSYDEAYTIPSEQAAQLSLRTMQILMHEIGAVRHGRSRWPAPTSSRRTTNEMEQRIVAIMERARRARAASCRPSPRAACRPR